MSRNISLTLRVIPVVLFLGLVFGLTTSAFAAGKVVSSERLPVDGAILMDDGSSVEFSGEVHIVSQAFELADGTLMVGLRANVANLKGEGDDFSEWVAVGANQYPPDPIFPPDPIRCTLPLDLIPLGSELPPNPVSPPVLRLVLAVDSEGRLLAVGSEAEVCNTDDKLCLLR